MNTKPWLGPTLFDPEIRTLSIFLKSLAVQMVKDLPALKKTQVQSLGQEDPLKNETATQSSILAWEIP